MERIGNPSKGLAAAGHLAARPCPGATLLSRPKSAGNHILDTIPQREYETIGPFLKQASLTRESVLYEPGAEIRECFFLGPGLVSCMQVMCSGETVEIGLVGREGVTGESVLVNGGCSSHRVFVHIAGDAVRIGAKELQRLLPRTPVLERRLLRFGYLQTLQAQQLAACNALHSIEQRLARWILTILDRVEQVSLPFTHDSIAGVLSARRATISVAAEAFRDAGGIDYKRGRLRVLDRHKLERLGCECYPLLHSQREGLLQSFSVDSAFDSLVISRVRGQYRADGAY